MLRLLLGIGLLLSISCSKERFCYTTSYGGKIWVERSSQDTVFNVGQVYSLSIDSFLYRYNDRIVDLRGDEYVPYYFGLYRLGDEDYEVVDSTEIQVQVSKGLVHFRPDAHYWGNYFKVTTVIESGRVKSNVDFHFLKPGQYALQLMNIHDAVDLLSEKCMESLEYRPYFVPDSGQIWPYYKSIILYVNP